MCLLDLLHRSCQREGLRLKVFHVNHGLRPESDAEALFVRAFSSHLDCDFAEGKLALAQGPSLEARARKARYEQLTALAQARGVDHLHTAHHLQDQIETVVMRLHRGAGAFGLRGIPSMRELAPNLTVVRPLIQVRKEDLHAYARERGIPHFFDQSNHNTRFLRNRVREEALPGLGPSRKSLEERILRCSEEASSVSDEVERFLNSQVFCVPKGAHWIAMRKRDLAQLPDRLRTELLKRILSRHRAFSSTPPSGKLLRAVLRGLYEVRGTQSVDGSMTLMIDPYFVGLRRAGNQDAADQDVELPALCATITEPTESDFESFRNNDSRCEEIRVDADKVIGRWSLASGRSLGAAYRPLNCAVTKSLKNLLAHPSIPKVARDSWPRLIDEEGVLQVPPHAPAQRVSLDGGTKRVLRVSFGRLFGTAAQILSRHENAEQA
jgi:tRNA(Ile)-lysidine synthetase-like protein